MSESGPPVRRTRSSRPSLDTTRTDFKVYNASKRCGEILDVWAHVGSGQAHRARAPCTESRQPARGAPVSAAFLGAPPKVILVATQFLAGAICVGVLMSAPGISAGQTIEVASQVTVQGTVEAVDHGLLAPTTGHHRPRDRRGSQGG
jgi:hypothetical protein